MSLQDALPINFPTPEVGTPKLLSPSEMVLELCAFRAHIDNAVITAEEALTDESRDRRIILENLIAQISSELKRSRHATYGTMGR